MYAVRKINDSYTWIGANDRRLAMFEGVYAVPAGVSYNSYFLDDSKTAVLDTVDKAVGEIFFENLEHMLCGRKLDYLIVQHMEPDHSATMQELTRRYPEAQIVCTKLSRGMIKNFFGYDEEFLDKKVITVGEGDTISTGQHTLKFILAPMVHWPEVMVTYDEGDKILFSADAFGTFGALNGALFADEVDFERDYMDEARRYYANIVGKYGEQVRALLNKANTVDIEMIAPLHGFVWRENLGSFIEKYKLWSEYEPETRGVMIAYASIYGHTENAAEVLAIKLREKGIPTVMYDVSVAPGSEIVAAAFKYSHLVFASCTYNTGIFISMDDLVNDLTAHNIQNRSVTVIENGSWAPASGKLITEKLSKCKNITFTETKLSIRSALTAQNAEVLETIANEIAELTQN
jgi:flavorubredoxin